MVAARRVNRRSIASVQLLDDPRQSRSRTVATTECPQRTNLVPLCLCVSPGFVCLRDARRYVTPDSLWPY